MARRDQQGDDPVDLEPGPELESKPELDPGLTVRRQTRGASGSKPQKHRVRVDGWTAQRRARFLEALAESCNVAEACRTVGMAKKSVYRLRQRDPGFAAEWAGALEQGYAELEMMLLGQAIFGSTTTERVDDGAEPGRTRVRTVHSFPHTTALRLLLSHKSRVDGFRDGQEAERPGSAEVREDIMRLIEEVRERLKQRAARAGARRDGEDRDSEGGDNEDDDGA